MAQSSGNKSLGLSLLQTYDEEEQYSDEEDDLKTDTTDVQNEDSSFIKCVSNDPETKNDLSSNGIEEVNPSLQVGESNILDSEKNDRVKIINEERTINEIDASSLDVTSDHSELKNPPPIEEQNLCEKKLDVNNTDKSKTLDGISVVIGLTESTTESVDTDTKPVKKVKLNRSKFVRPADESSNETKVSPIITDSSLSNSSINIPPTSVINEKQSEVVCSKVVEKSIENTSTSILGVDSEDTSTIISEEEVPKDHSEVENCDESKDDSISESANIDVNVSEEIEENSAKEPVSPVVIPEKTEMLVAEEVETNEEREDDSFLKSTNLESVDSLTRTDSDVNQFEEVEMKSAVEPTQMEVSSSEESIENNEDDVDMCQSNIKDDIFQYSNEEVEKQNSRESSDYKSDDEGINLVDEKNENIESAHDISEEVENVMISEREDSRINIDLNAKVVENTDRIIESVVRAEHCTSDEDVYEDAVESIPSKPAEISKLEQALTGRLEGCQVHLKKFDPPFATRKEQEQTRYDPSQEVPTVGKSKSVSEDTKQNIKLHLSVQGDRVSIKNTLSSMDGSTPVRVKRQYRKRVKAPGELEQKKAHAKEYTNRLRQRTERETPGAKKRGRKKKIQNDNMAGMMFHNASNVHQHGLPESMVPLNVAIDRNSSTESNVVGKVQPIKLKIGKNSNVTIECTSKYDVLTGGEVRTVSEKMVSVTEEVRKKENISNYMEKATLAWSGPDMKRVERLLKENVTITPVVSNQATSPQSSSSMKTVSSSREFSSHQIINEESMKESFLSSTMEVSESSTNVSLSLKADDEQHSPWKIMKPNTEANFSSMHGNMPPTIDVKSEIRKKIASVEKRKQEINIPGMESMYNSLQKIGDIVSDFMSMNTPTTESAAPNSSVESMEVDYKPDELMTAPLLIPPLSTSPMTPSTPTVSHSKLSNLPSELFPKKRGRPTKAMVAAREAYRQKQEELKTPTPGSTGEGDVPGETNISGTELGVLPTESPKIKSKRGRKPKKDRLEKKDSEDLSVEEQPPDPVREAEEQKRLEEERIKKEEERERKNELRRLKAKERSDLVKAKRLRQKMKAKERHKLAKELRRLQQEEKKKLQEQLKSLPVSMGYDDDTRMSAENSQAPNMSFSTGMIDDDSSGATNDVSQKLKKSRLEVTDTDSKDLMVDQIAEYQWPIQGGELYMIQEQVSNFLGVKSFKRKYPDIWRRPVDSEERAYLVDSGLVSETLCDLGITAVRSSEVLDIMCSDFSEKYEEFRRYMREKQMKELSFKQKAWANGLGYKLLMADGSKQDMKKRAMESASNWNLALNKSRIEDRRCHMDLQTFIIHFPKHRGAKMTVPSPKVGSYPVTILPGQFCDYYKEYTPTELRYMPVNTVLYGPLKQPTAAQNDDASQTDSDDSSSSDESSTTSEDTQATEETLEDMDKDASLDGFAEIDSTCIDEKEEQPDKMSQEKMNDVLAADGVSDKPSCKVCLGDQSRNKQNAPELMISCSQCTSTSHPTCLDLSLEIVPQIKSYEWQCPDCKVCAQCKENADEDKMLFCDTCDRGYHIYCVGLTKVPPGSWQCQKCTIFRSNQVHWKPIVPVMNESNLIEITG